MVGLNHVKIGRLIRLDRTQKGIPVGLDHIKKKKKLEVQDRIEIEEVAAQLD